MCCQGIRKEGNCLSARKDRSNAKRTFKKRGKLPAIQMNSVKNKLIRVSLQRLQVAHIHLRDTSAP